MHVPVPARVIEQRPRAQVRGRVGARECRIVLQDVHQAGFGDELVRCERGGVELRRVLLGCFEGEEVIFHGGVREPDLRFSWGTWGVEEVVVKTQTCGSAEAGGFGYGDQARQNLQDVVRVREAVIGVERGFAAGVYEECFDQFV